MGYILASVPFYTSGDTTPVWNCNDPGIDVTIVCSGGLKKSSIFIGSEVICFIMVAVIGLIVIFFILSNPYDCKSLAY